MMKRLWAMLAAFLLLSGSALASTPIASYTLPAGAEVLHLWDSGAWQAPEGLEGMYTLMQIAEGNVYLVRMPNGRAMVSVSSTETPGGRTAQEMLELWPQIAANIAREGVAVDAGENCASVENLYGFDALHIETDITVGEWGQGLSLDAEGIAFLRDRELLEVWAVAPAKETYAQDETAAGELAADVAAMEMFMQSLNFTDLEELSVEGEAYIDPEGRFAVVIPAGSTVITASTPQADVDAARQTYLSAHKEGADKLFDEYMRDIETQNVTVFISPNQNLVAEVSASREETFLDMTADQLAQLSPVIERSLADRFDIAVLLSNQQRLTISGHKHAWLACWLRSGEVDTQLDILAAVLDDAWLYEVDLFTHNGDQTQRTLWNTMITQTMRYTPLQNALD